MISEQIVRVANTPCLLLSVGSGVQISSGTPENSLQAFVFKGLQLFFCYFAAFRTIIRKAGMIVFRESL